MSSTSFTRTLPFPAGTPTGYLPLENEPVFNAAVHLQLEAPASTEILFDTPFHLRWVEAGKALGVDMMSLSDESGHA